ncbi:elongation factor Ts [Candidatus Parcubacteria bacterium]|nr:elongation factor Ts [Candidatus Parcubacteria bacterium]
MTNADLIKELRERTGVSVGEIRAALEEANGDSAAALEILKRRGAAVAERKASREVHEGLVETYVHGGKIGAMVALLCETDFVARSDDFITLAHDLAMHIAATDPQSAEDLLAAAFIKDPNQTVRQRIEATVARVGENIRVGRFARFSI